MALMAFAPAGFISYGRLARPKASKPDSYYKGRNFDRCPAPPPRRPGMMAHARRLCGEI